MTEKHEIQVGETHSDYIYCTIDDKEYRISTFLSVGNCSDIEVYLESEEHEYRAEIARLFWDKIECCDNEKPPLESIVALHDDCLQKMIWGMLQSDAELLTTYQELTDTDDSYHRFMLSVQRYTEKIYSDMSTTIAEDILEIIKTNDIHFEKAWKAATDAINSISSAFSVISERVRKFEENYGNQLQKFITALGETTIKLQLPDFSEEEIAQILDAYAQWGKCGWTPPMGIQFNQMYTPPLNQQQADEKMLRYCTDAEVERLFEQIRKQPLACQNDFEEAVFCYTNQKFKACALLLFALLDGLVISHQKEKDKNPHTHRRDSGHKAFDKLHERFIKTHPDSKIPKLFVCKAMVACFSNFFEQGKDFVNEPQNLNRNYVDHGMGQRKVEKTDCIKLFLLYQHTLHFLRTL